MTKDCKLPTAYRAKTLFGDHRRSCKKEGWLGFIPLHETLSAVVDSASADEWCVYDPLEEVLEADLVRTCSRLGTGRDRMAALRIWGDHAEYHTRDSLGLIMFSVMTGKVRRRFLICGFSKRSQCRCGCKGQCTFQTVWDVIGWSLRALIARRWPKMRHDNVLFSESALPGDRERAQRAGEVIPIGAVIQKKCGDWSWMKSAVGLQGWKDGVEGEVLLWLWCELHYASVDRPELRCLMAFDYVYTSVLRIPPHVRSHSHHRHMVMAWFHDQHV